MNSNITTIGEVAEIYDGPHATPEKTAEGPYYLSISSLDKGRLDLSKSAHLSREDYKKWTKRIVPEAGDLLFSYETRLGEAALMPIGIEGCLGRRMGLLRAKRDKVLPEYLLYAYLSPAFQQTIITNTIRGATVDRIPIAEMPKFPIRIPSLDEQEKVVRLLRSIDNKIEVNNLINIELEQMAKTLYDYWFVQFDFPDERGKPYKSAGGKMVYNEILKRNIPKGWEVNKLGKVLKTFLGGTPSTTNKNFWDGDIPWMNSGEVANFPLIFTEQKITQEALENSSTTLLKAGSVLLSITRHLRVNILGIDACINQSIVGIEESKMFKNSYTYFSILNDIERLMSLRTGAQQPHINKEIVDESPFIMPNEEVLELYYKTAAPIIGRILNNANQNQQLATLRDWLLPMLMNGQVKVTSSEMSVKQHTSVGAQALTGYGKAAKLTIASHKKGFAKQVLAGKIVSKFINDPSFTDIKFQKIQFLAEHIIEADLNLNYYCQAAGPYDNKFMHTIYTDFRKQKWFDYQNKRFIPLEKQEKIEEYYQVYFANAQDQLNKLFGLLYKSSEGEAEIIATLYAVWNNRILLNQKINDEVLFEDFYNWSDRKGVYSSKEVKGGLDWLRVNHYEPIGFGNVIKKAINKR